MTERLQMGQSYQPVLQLLNNKTCINPILLLLYYNLLGLYFVFVVDGRKGGVVGKRAVGSISRRQFSNRIDLNAIVARRHIGTLDQNSFQSTKGQLISKCPLGVIVWTKIPTKKFPRFLPQPLRRGQIKNFIKPIMLNNP